MLEKGKKTYHRHLKELEVHKRNICRPTSCGSSGCHTDSQVTTSFSASSQPAIEKGSNYFPMLTIISQHSFYDVILFMLTF